MVDKYYEENPIVLDYNTEREKLSIPEYGRNVLKMVESEGCKGQGQAYRAGQGRYPCDGNIESAGAFRRQLGA